jgi:hypothetical protein
MISTIRPWVVGVVGVSPPAIERSIAILLLSVFLGPDPERGAANRTGEGP